MAEVLAGRYELERVIGEGGMATVWRGRDSRLDRPVAVKVMAERISNDPEFRARFLQEARAAASFSHPNIVDVLDYGEEDGKPYMVMELVDGEDLRSRLARDGRLDADEVARIGAGIARGLAAAHRRGLIHRDIKPANILIDAEGVPKLTDFGIVRALGQSTQTRQGMTLGSVHYLSPEQVQGTPIDERSDIYSLGVVLYEAATGQRPFDDDAPAAVAVRRLSEAPRPPHLVEPSLPQWLSAVIEKAMQRDAERRYRTASELEHDLAVRRPPRSAAEVAEDTAQVALPVPVRGRGGAVATRVRRDVRDRRGGPTELRGARTDTRGAPTLGTRRGALLPFVAAVVAALALIGVGVFFLLGAGGALVPVPDVRSQARDQAIDTLHAAGFAVDSRCCDDDDVVPDGAVIRQEPTPPALRPSGSTVKIFVSRGIGDTSVPIVRDLTLEAAKTELEKAGLTFDHTTTRQDDSIANGRVADSLPAQGTVVKRKTPVTLILSSGPARTNTPTPSLSGPLPSLSLPVATPTR